MRRTEYRYFSCTLSMQKTQLLSRRGMVSQGTGTPDQYLHVYYHASPPPARALIRPLQSLAVLALAPPRSNARLFFSLPLPVRTPPPSLNSLAGRPSALTQTKRKRHIPPHHLFLLISLLVLSLFTSDQPALFNSSSRALILFPRSPSDRTVPSPSSLFCLLLRQTRDWCRAGLEHSRLIASLNVGQVARKESRRFSFLIILFYVARPLR